MQIIVVSICTWLCLIRQLENSSIPRTIDREAKRGYDSGVTLTIGHGTQSIQDTSPLCRTGFCVQNDKISLLEQSREILLKEQGWLICKPSHYLGHSENKIR